MTDRLRLTGIQMYGIIGDLPHEREHPQPIEIDVEVELDLVPAARSDSLSKGLDYRKLYSAVQEAISTEPRLLESLAERIADRVLTVDMVDSVRVCCRKPRAALTGPVHSVEVEILRLRES